MNIGWTDYSNSPTSRNDECVSHYELITYVETPIHGTMGKISQQISISYDAVSSWLQRQGLLHVDNPPHLTRQPHYSRSISTRDYHSKWRHKDDTYGAYLVHAEQLHS